MDLEAWQQEEWRRYEERLAMRVWLGRYRHDPKSWFIVCARTRREAAEHIDGIVAEPDTDSFTPLREPAFFGFQVRRDQDDEDEYWEPFILEEEADGVYLEPETLEVIGKAMDAPKGEPRLEVSRVAHQLGITDPHVMGLYMNLVSPLYDPDGTVAVPVQLWEAIIGASRTRADSRAPPMEAGPLLDDAPWPPGLPHPMKVHLTARSDELPILLGWCHWMVDDAEEGLHDDEDEVDRTFATVKLALAKGLAEQIEGLTEQPDASDPMHIPVSLDSDGFRALLAFLDIWQDSVQMGEQLGDQPERTPKERNLIDRLRTSLGAQAVAAVEARARAKAQGLAME